MNPRVVVPGLLVVAVITVLVILGGGGGDGVIDDGSPSRGSAPSGDPFAVALSYLPSSPEAVMTVETATEGSPAGSASELIGALTGADPREDLTSSAELDAPGPSSPADLTGAVDALRPLAGNPIVVAVPPGATAGDPPEEDEDAFALARLPLAREARVAWVTAGEEALDAYVSGLVTDGTLERASPESGHEVFRSPTGTAIATRGAVLVVAPDLDDLRDAIALSRGEADEGKSSLSSGALNDYLAGLPGRGTAFVRASVTRDALLRGVPGLEAFARASTWAEAVGRVALALVPDGDALQVPFRLSTAGSGVSADDLPIAPGPDPPEPSGDAPVLLAVRDLGRTLTFLRGALEATDQGLAGQVDLLEGALARFARVDLVADLVRPLDGTATLLADDEDVTLRAATSDALGIGEALDRSRRVLSVRNVLGEEIDTAGLTVERDSDDAFDPDDEFATDPDDDVGADDVGDDGLDDEGLDDAELGLDERSDPADDPDPLDDAPADLDDARDRFTLARSGETLATIGVTPDEVVVTNDEFGDLGTTSPSREDEEEDDDTDLDGPVTDAGADVRPPADEAGALLARIGDPEAALAFLGPLLGLPEGLEEVVAGLEALELTARAEPERIDGVLRLDVR